MVAEMVSKGFVPTVDAYAGVVVKCEKVGERYTVDIESKTGGPWEFTGMPGPFEVGTPATVTVTTNAEGQVRYECEPRLTAE